MKVDAVIVQDFGVMELINRKFPDLPIHASTQMSNINSYDLKFLEKFNVKRAVIDRHLTFDEIKRITEESPIEVEIFVHGALCYSFSGQCIFSSFLGGQSANRGRCTQPCRRRYVLNKEKTGFYFSPNDLSTIKLLEKFLQLNVASCKIEGRMKSAQYVANVTKAYRILIDFFHENGNITNDVLKESEKLIRESYGRKTTLGYYFYDKQPIVEPKLSGATGIYAGKALESSYKMLKFKTGIDLNIGDRIRIQEIRASFNIKQIFSDKGKILNFGKKNSVVSIPVEKNVRVKRGNLIFKVGDCRDAESVKKIKIKRKKFRIEKNITNNLLLSDDEHTKSEYYLKLGDVRHLTGLPDYFSDYLIIPLHSFNNYKSTGGKFEKFRERIFIELPPFVFEKDLEELSLITDVLIKEGFRKFFLNSKGQTVLFNCHEDKEFFLIASERFHVANSYSCSFLKKAGINRWVTDIENDKKNYENMVLKSNSVILLYSKYPLLVSRVPTGLKNNSFLEDNKKKKFYFKQKRGLYHIYSNETFNISFRINEFKQMGYNKFLYDVSLINNFKRGIKSFYNSLKYGKLKTGNEFNYNFNLE